MESSRAGWRTTVWALLWAAFFTVGCAHRIDPGIRAAINEWGEIPTSARTGYRGLPSVVVHRSTGIEMLLVEPGEYWRGGRNDPEATVTELPPVRSRIFEPFYLGRFEVTREEWARGSAVQSPERDAAYPRLPIPGRDDAFPRWPIVDVTGCELEAFLSRNKLRLPGERQWEYACRAGNEAPRYGKLDEVAWYETPGHAIQPVGGKRPNAWGFYDMLGNAAEVVADIEDVATEGKGVLRHRMIALNLRGERHRKVIRGGSVAFLRDSCRASWRMLTLISVGLQAAGFRVAHDAPALDK